MLGFRYWHLRDEIVDAVRPDMELLRWLGRSDPRLLARIVDRHRINDKTAAWLWD